MLTATADVLPGADGQPSKIDAGTTATFAFPGDATGTATCHMRVPPALGVVPRFPTMQLKVNPPMSEMGSPTMRTVLICCLKKVAAANSSV